VRPLSGPEKRNPAAAQIGSGSPEIVRSDVYKHLNKQGVIMENKKVFIGNLDFEVTEGELKNLLLKYGVVVSIKMFQKKGYAFVEMGTPEEAAKTVQKMDGTRYKDREMRVSLELKAGKARSVSVKQYKERGQSLSKERTGKDSDPRSRSEKQRDSSKSRPSRSTQERQGGGSRSDGRSSGSEEKTSGESRRERPGLPRPEQDRWATERPSVSARPAKKEWARDENKGSFGSYGRSFEKSKVKSEERNAASGNRPMKDYTKENSAGAPRPPKREWTAEKPSYSGRPARDGERSGNSRPGRPDSGNRPGGRTPRSDEGTSGDYSKERSGSPRPPKREWTAEKPSHSGRPVRDGERSSSPQPPRKEWSSDRPARPSRETGDSWKERSDKRESSGDKPRDYSKPRSVSGSQNRFSRTSKPGSPAGGRKGASGSSRPESRGGSAGRDRNKPEKKD
jgi:RNA recognition motif-containing protein